MQQTEGPLQAATGKAIWLQLSEETFGAFPDMAICIPIEDHFKILQALHGLDGDYRKP